MKSPECPKIETRDRNMINIIFGTQWNWELKVLEQSPRTFGSIPMMTLVPNRENRLEFRPTRNSHSMIACLKILRLRGTLSAVRRRTVSQKSDPPYRLMPYSPSHRSHCPIRVMSCFKSEVPRNPMPIGIRWIFVFTTLSRDSIVRFV